MFDIISIHLDIYVLHHLYPYEYFFNLYFLLFNFSSFKTSFFVDRSLVNIQFRTISCFLHLTSTNGRNDGQFVSLLETEILAYVGVLHQKQPLRQTQHVDPLSLDLLDESLHFCEAGLAGAGASVEPGDDLTQ